MKIRPQVRLSPSSAPPSSQPPAPEAPRDPSIITWAGLWGSQLHKPLPHCLPPAGSHLVPESREPGAESRSLVAHEHALLGPSEHSRPWRPSMSRAGPARRGRPRVGASGTRRACLSPPAGRRGGAQECGAVSSHLPTPPRSGGFRPQVCFQRLWQGPGIEDTGGYRSSCTRGRGEGRGGRGDGEGEGGPQEEGRWPWQSHVGNSSL